jgi:hypothetical protein
MPSCYRAILARDPKATFLEVPVFSSDTCLDLNSCRLYWQSLHGAPTTAGYSGRPNRDFDDRLVDGTPFGVAELADPDFLSDDRARSFGIIDDQHVLEYAWLYMHVHDFRYVTVPHWRPITDAVFVHWDHLDTALRPAQVHAEDAVTVYAHALMTPPRDATLVLNGGFHLRRSWPGPPTAAVERSSRIEVYAPEGAGELELMFQAQGFLGTRHARLLEGTRELAGWEIAPDEMRTYITPPLRFEAGAHTLRIECDGDDRPKHRLEQIAEGNPKPYSALMRSVRFGPVSELSTIATRAEVDAQTVK